MHKAPENFSSIQQLHPSIYTCVYAGMHTYCAHMHVRSEKTHNSLLPPVNAGFKKQLNIDIFTSRYFLFKSKQPQQEPLLIRT